MDLTDEEKNKVLAKWAGWEFVRSECHDIMHFIDYWRHPSEPNCERTLPDLFHSLDAQAKWLWPKLDSLQLVTLWPERKAKFRAEIAIDINGASFIRESPAEACAEAVLSLIKEEANE